MAQAALRTEIDRLSTDREKTGVALGADAINPVNGERIPIFVADYVLGGYGTGAIMAVPAHDERDYAFAEKFGLPIRRVVAAAGDEDRELEGAYVAHAADERLVNSGPYSGVAADEAGRAIVAELESRGAGKAAVTYRLRDWLVSRQRYWGAPIPVIYCDRDGIVPVPDEDLPVRLPDTVDYRGSGENPLARDEAFLNVTCPKCGGPARRETDTMDTFVDSSWYWFRYLSPEKAGAPIERTLVDQWTPVDQYTGGSEHAVMHLLYAREWTKMMRDIGLVDQSEPFRRLFNQGQILGLDGERMSKSRGNVVDPGRPGRALRRGHDPPVPDVHGALGPGRPVEPDRHRRRAPVPEPGLDADARPARHRIRATRRPAACPRARRAGDADATLRSAAHRTLRDVTARLRELPLQHDGGQADGAVERAPSVPRHRGRRRRGLERGRPPAAADAGARPRRTSPRSCGRGRSRRAAQPWASIHVQSWPEVDAAAVVETTREVPVQVNGKLRDLVVVPTATTDAELQALALASPKVQAALAGRVPKRVVVAGGGRLVNLVVG